MFLGGRLLTQADAGKPEQWFSRLCFCSQRCLMLLKSNEWTFKGNNSIAVWHVSLQFVFIERIVAFICFTSATENKPATGHPVTFCLDTWFTVSLLYRLFWRCYCMIAWRLHSETRRSFTCLHCFLLILDVSILLWITIPEKLGRQLNTAWKCRCCFCICCAFISNARFLTSFHFSPAGCQRNSLHTLF